MSESIFKINIDRHVIKLLSPILYNDFFIVMWGTLVKTSLFIYTICTKAIVQCAKSNRENL